MGLSGRVPASQPAEVLVGSAILDPQGNTLCKGGGHDGFNFVCNYLGYGAATGDHPTGDYQGGCPCWAIGEADGRVNQSYCSCGGGCTHWAYVECYVCP